MQFITRLLIVIFEFFIIISAKQNWKFDIVSIYSNTSNANTFDLDIKLDRISRGVYGLSGFVDIKQDVYDAVANVKVYRSSTGYEKDYQITPFAIDNEHLEEVMNTHYKTHFMAAAKDCATDSPQFETFQAPLKKIQLEFEKCLVQTDNFPNYMPPGYFKLYITITNETLFTIYVELVISIESSNSF